jgi:hypothetical protein
MRATHYLAAVVTLLLMGSYTLARGDEKVLVPGDPPLTQQTFDLYQEMWQWYCDIKLTPEQQREFQKRYIMFWKKRDKASNQKLLATYETMEKEWRDTLKLEGAEQKRKRDKVRDNWMAALRTFKDDLSPFMVSLYDSAYKPGGTKNAILVASDPPLTEKMLELNTCVVEMMFDTPLTDEQRREFRQICIDDWKKADRAKRQDFARTWESQADVPTWNNLVRNVKRAFNLQINIEKARKATTATDRWLVTTYDSLVKPGSERNPILVEGTVPLTQLMVDQYRDYAEIMIDMSFSGGFSLAQRAVLQAYLVKEWKNMTDDEKKDFFADVKEWFDAAGKGTRRDEAMKLINAMRAKSLVRLRGDTRESSKWLLETLAQERKMEANLTELQRIQFEAMRFIIRSSGSSWEFNQTTRRYEYKP